MCKSTRASTSREYYQCVWVCVGVCVCVWVWVCVVFIIMYPLWCSQTEKLKGYNFNDGNTLYFPVLWVSEVRYGYVHARMLV